MTQTVAARPDTRDMVIIHRVFRREFRLAPQLVRGVAPGDTTRAQLVAAHVRELHTMLHHHHTTEDELLWPRLRARAALSGELVDRMEAEHAVVERLLAELDVRLPAWALTAEASAGSAVAALLDDLNGRLVAHLDGEERDVLPLCRDHLTVAEWAELGERGSSGTPRNRRMVLLGHILEDATPEERRLFLSHLPAVARLLYRLVGHRGYDREVSALRQGIVPEQRRA